MPDPFPKNDQTTKKISRNGNPITKLSRTHKNVDSRLGKHQVMGKVKINYDPTEDNLTESGVFNNQEKL